MPKLSSLTLRDKAFLDHVGLPGEVCVFCGYEHGPVRVENHHEPHRSHLPKKEQHRLPRFAADGFGNSRGWCHGLLHGNGGRLRILEPVHSGGVCEWRAVADEDAAAQINNRRRLCGLAPIVAEESWHIGYEGE